MPQALGVNHVVGTNRAVHLTRRGRLSLLVTLVALLLAMFSLRQARSDAATPAPAGASYGSATQHAAATQPARVAQRARATQTTVHRGDTLWSVARRLAPDRDVRETVADLRALNRLSGATLRVGQQLLLPERG